MYAPLLAFPPIRAKSRSQDQPFTTASWPAILAAG